MTIFHLRQCAQHAGKLNFSQSRFSMQYRQFSLMEFPWKQSKTDIFKTDPFIHRAVGFFLLRRMLSEVRISFDVKEFANGAKSAILALIHSIQSTDKDRNLEGMLGSSLYRQMNVAFKNMRFDNEYLNLEVEKIENLKVSGARFLFGEADAGDEEIVSYLGQKVILSRSEVDGLADEASGLGASKKLISAFTDGKRVGEEALFKSISFQIDIKFETLERLYLTFPLSEDNEGEHDIVEGSQDLMKCYHKITMETPVQVYRMQSVSEYPLSWSIVDIDDHLGNR